MTDLRTAFQPDEIALLRSALNDAVTLLPTPERTSAMKLKLATRIIAAAASGERDPNRLKSAALLRDENIRKT